MCPRARSPASVREHFFAEGVGDQPARPRGGGSRRRPRRTGDPRRLLAPVLERVQPQVGELGGLGVPETATIPHTGVADPSWVRAAAPRPTGGRESRSLHTPRQPGRGTWTPAGLRKPRADRGAGTAVDRPCEAADCSDGRLGNTGRSPPVESEAAPALNLICGLPQRADTNTAERRGAGRGRPPPVRRRLETHPPRQEVGGINPPTLAGKVAMGCEEARLWPESS
jgi:hypothetical protein